MNSQLFPATASELSTSNAQYLPTQVVLFDCDGVLVDSEPVVNEVLRNCLIERGWTGLSPQECVGYFVGKSLEDQRELIEARTGQPLTKEWIAYFRGRRNTAITEQVEAVPHIHAAVTCLHQALGGRIAVCSGADRYKVELQLGKVGLLPQFAAAIFSGQEMPHNKPAPDVYQAAMRHFGLPPTACVVVEDSPTGAAAGVAAGARVLGYVANPSHHEHIAALQKAGVAGVFHSMAELPNLVGVA